MHINAVNMNWCYYGGQLDDYHDRHGYDVEIATAFNNICPNLQCEGQDFPPLEI